MANTNDKPGLLGILKSLTGGDDRYIPTNPLIQTGIQGAVGAGLGYGAGLLADRLLPSDEDDPQHGWNKSTIRRNFTLAGLGLGAAPGLSAIARNYAGGKSLLNSDHMRLGNLQFFKEDLPRINEKYKRQRAAKRGNFDPHKPVRWSNMPLLDADQVNNIVFNSPSSASLFTPGTQSLFQNTVNAAAAISPQPGSLFTPSDVGRLAAGMGSGYAGGYLAGKMLGALVGLPQSAQNALSQYGTMGGAAKSLLPLFYR